MLLAGSGREDISEADALAVLQKIDADGSGTIEREEFLNAIEEDPGIIEALSRIFGKASSLTSSLLEAKFNKQTKNDNSLDSENDDVEEDTQYKTSNADSLKTQSKNIVQNTRKVSLKSCNMIDNEQKSNDNTIFGFNKGETGNKRWYKPDPEFQLATKAVGDAITTLSKVRSNAVDTKASLSASTRQLMAQVNKNNIEE